MKNQDHIGIAERGRILSASEELYTVESLDREGIVCPGIVALAGNSFLPGDFVYFVSFADGTGCVLCNATGHVGRTPIIFYATAPPTSGMIPGDTWIDTDGDNALYEYTLQGWVARPFGGSAIGPAIMADIAAAKQTAEEAKEAADAAITETVRQYTVTQTTDPPGAGASWSTATPAWAEGSYIWERTLTTYGSGSTVTSSPVLLTGNTGEDAVLLRLDSSAGVMFKNNNVNTVLSVTIFKGSRIITDADTMHDVFGAGAYIQWTWKRLDDERYGIISADDSRIYDGGFKFRLSPDDVDTKVTFQCTLMI